MTKLIAILMVVVVAFIGYHLFEYWQSVAHEDDLKQTTTQVVSENQLQGMPYQLQPSLDAAKARGADGLRDWLNTYGPKIQDPRKAWIQLDYCLLVSREDVSEAKRVFAEVKARTSKSSPVWPRVKELEKTYD